MKKFLVVMIVALMGAGIANAQFKFGIKAGVNVNHLSKDITDLKNNQAGWTAGVTTEFKVPLLGFGADLSVMYARLSSSEYKNFIQIPLNIKYKFSLPVVGSMLAPYLFTGPSFDFKLDKNIATQEGLKTFQPVWNIGAGLEFFNHVQIGASYGFGLNKVVKYLPYGGDINAQNYHNNYWTISAAYLF